MRELDELLTYFLEHQHAHLTERLQARFRDWLDLPDPVLWDRVTGALPEDALDLDLILRLRAFPGLVIPRNGSEAIFQMSQASENLKV